MHIFSNSVLLSLSIQNLRMRPLGPYKREQKLLMGSEGVVADISIIVERLLSTTHIVFRLFFAILRLALYNANHQLPKLIVANKNERE